LGAHGTTHDGNICRGTNALIEGRKIIFNTAFRWSGEIFTKALWLVFVIILARRLGSNGFGYFNYAFSFGSMLIVLTDLGTNMFIVKTVSRDTDLAGYYLTNVFFLKVLLSGAVFIAIAVYANAHARLSRVLFVF
jgi:O-antigen/teichoic acid export membrane protein